MTEEKKPCCESKTTNKLYRPSELPIYGNPNPPKDYVKHQDTGILESNIKSVRHEVTNYVGSLSSTTNRTKEIFNTAYNHTRSTYDYISDEANTVPKAIAITTGGLIGILLSSRKGFFKKITYTGLGMTVAASACYPKQAKEIVQLSYYIIKTYGPHLIREYTGIDLNKKFEDIFAKKKDQTSTSDQNPNQIGEKLADVQYYGFRLEDKNRPSDSDSGSDSENKPKETKETNETNETKETKEKPKIQGDYGQSNKDDQDLYANRSTK